MSQLGTSWCFLLLTQWINAKGIFMCKLHRSIITILKSLMDNIRAWTFFAITFCKSDVSGFNENSAVLAKTSFYGTVPPVLSPNKKNILATVLPVKYELMQYHLVLSQSDQNCHFQIPYSAMLAIIHGEIVSEFI